MRVLKNESLGMRANFNILVLYGGFGFAADLLSNQCTIAERVKC